MQEMTFKKKGKTSACWNVPTCDKILNLERGYKSLVTHICNVVGCFCCHMC